MRIEVKENHVENGLRGVARACPVAIAMTEAGLTDVSVDATEAFYTDVDGHEWQHEFSEDVTGLIREFDRDGTMPLFGFEI